MPEANGQDYCFVKAEQNGKFLLQTPKPRAEIETPLKACRAGATFNPHYLAEFPNSYRVVQGMVVGNPRDNVLRAIGAFYQLSEIINVLAERRGSRGYTPDEKKLLDDYSRIQTELAQAATQKLPGQQFNITANPYHYSRSDPRFGFEGIPVWTTFLSPALQTQFAQIVGGNDPQNKPRGFCADAVPSKAGEVIQEQKLDTTPKAMKDTFVPFRDVARTPGSRPAVISSELVTLIGRGKTTNLQEPVSLGSSSFSHRARLMSPADWTCNLSILLRIHALFRANSHVSEYSRPRGSDS